LTADAQLARRLALAERAVDLRAQLLARNAGDRFDGRDLLRRDAAQPHLVAIELGLGEPQARCGATETALALGEAFAPCFQGQEHHCPPANNPGVPLFMNRRRYPHRSWCRKRGCQSGNGGSNLLWEKGLVRRWE